MSRYPAPAVSYPVGPCRFCERVAFAVWLCGVLVLGLSWQGRAVDAVGLLVAMSLGVGLARAARRPPMGALRWDGAGWSWAAGACAPEPVMAAELVWRGRQRLLMRLHGAPVGWVWAERARDPQRWKDLCRAAWATRR